MSDAPADATGFGRDPKPVYLAVAVLVVLELLRRALLGYVPDDFTAYLSAADIFVAGGHPYGDAIFETARYNGKVYNYLPGTLWFIAPLAWLPTVAAVAVDWVCRVAALGFALRVFWSRLLPQTSFHFVLLVALIHEPLTIDLLFGNVVTYLLAAFAACVWVAERPGRGADYAVAALAGLVLAFKPFWVFAGLFALAAHRRWRLFAACAAGAGVIVLTSLPFWELTPVYLARLEAMAKFYYSVALGTFAPWAVPLVALLWLALGVQLIRRGAQNAWVWGACSMPFWPRLGTYSYVMTIPLILFLVSRYGWPKGLAASAVLIGPIPWLLRTAPGFEKSFLLEAWTHWVWVWVMAVVIYLALWRGRDEPA